MANFSPKRVREPGFNPLSPMSFFISTLSTISEVGDVSGSRSSLNSRSQRFSVERTSEAHSSSGSADITALPRWEGIKNAGRGKLGLKMPLPRFPGRAHVRKTSEVPMLEKDGFVGRESDEFERSNSPLERNASSASNKRPVEEKTPPWRTTTCLVCMLVAVIVLIIILGATLGMLMRSRHPAPTPSVTEIPAGSVPTPTGLPGDIETSQPLPPASHITSLATTGWSVLGIQGYDSVWLFWQDSRGFLSRATFNSSTGNWTVVKGFVEAKRGTPIAAATFDTKWYEGDDDYSFIPGARFQTSVIFLDDHNHLCEWKFPDSGPATGQPGPLTAQKYIAHEQTRLSSYWPHSVYQGPSGEIRGIHYACHERGECWHERVMQTTEARNGTQLLALPVADNMTALEVLYQEDGGRVLEYREEEEYRAELWENAAFSHQKPIGASLAGFSTASKNAADVDLNTFLLWQDANSTIQMSWTLNGGGWRGPLTFPAFAGAEKDTALACLTGLTFTTQPLPPGTELARCFFQTGRALREVSFDGERWKIVGVVPIDF